MCCGKKLTPRRGGFPRNEELVVRRDPPGKCTTGGGRSLMALFFLCLCSQVVRELAAQRRSEGRGNSASYHSEADERIQQVPQAVL